jgi:hypothetical protein
LKYLLLILLSNCFSFFCYVKTGFDCHCFLM